MKFSSNSLLGVVDVNLPRINEARARDYSPLGIDAHHLYLSSNEKSCIDDAGNEIVGGLWIEERGKQYQYRNNNLWVLGKKLEKIHSKDLKKILGYLNKLNRKSGYAYRMIYTLENSHNRFTIKISDCNYSYMVLPISDGKMGVLNNNAYAFQILETEKMIVDYAPYDRIGSSAEIRWNPKNGLFKIAHELGHAYDANFGLMDSRAMIIDRQVVLKREIRAVYHENKIRLELKKPLRKSMKDIKMMIVDGSPVTYPLPYLARH